MPKLACKCILLMYMVVKKIKLLTATLLYVLALGLVNVGLAAADSRPYFKAYGADTFSGGGINSGPTSCNPSDSSYQAPNYAGPSNLYKGGVMGFGTYDANSQKAKGAGSEFGALALGIIEGNSTAVGEPYGFSSGTSGYNKTSFANQSTITANNYWGGFLEGTVHQTHCIPDYFSTKQNSPQIIASANDVAALNSGQYLINGSGITNVASASPIAATKKITLFVAGDVFVSSSITYGAHNVDNVPKFTLVVKGNIYIANDVGQLDGLYIAQPYSVNEAGVCVIGAGGPCNGTGGIIWTCHTNAVDPPTDVYISAACRNKLTINGAFIAKKVNLVRVNGDVSSAAPNELASSANIAEAFNFTPEMVVGGGFFNSAGATANKIQSLISLPPVF